jgi:hypothetical protein
MVQAMGQLLILQLTMVPSKPKIRWEMFVMKQLTFFLFAKILIPVKFRTNYKITHQLYAMFRKKNKLKIRRRRR